jgi:lysophospholipase L1-like esterase
MSRALSLSPVFFAALITAACGGSTAEVAAPERTERATGVLTYVSLGDSIAFGIGASQQGFVGQLDQHFEADLGVEVRTTNLAVPGWTSSDLLMAIRGIGEFREAIRNADILTFEIGGNDLLAARRQFLSGQCGGSDGLGCLRTTVETFRANWTAIVQEIVSLRAGRISGVRTMDVYNPFVDIQIATGTQRLLKPFLEQVNDHIAQTALASNVPVARVYRAFNGPTGDEDALAKGLLAPDRIHPSDAGHRLIAELFRQLGAR